MSATAHDQRIVAVDWLLRDHKIETDPGIALQRVRIALARLHSKAKRLFEQITDAEEDEEMVRWSWVSGMRRELRETNEEIETLSAELPDGAR